jgi:hypothetical protein
MDYHPILDDASFPNDDVGPKDALLADPNIRSDHRTSVKDDPIADPRSSTDHDLGPDGRVIPKFHVLADNGGRMLSGWRAIQRGTEQIQDANKGAVWVVDNDLAPVGHEKSAGGQDDSGTALANVLLVVLVGQKDQMALACLFGQRNSKNGAGMRADEFAAYFLGELLN